MTFESETIFFQKQFFAILKQGFVYKGVSIPLVKQGITLNTKNV